MKQSFICFMVVSALALAVGCAKPPADKLAAAEKAVNEARAAGAPAYVAEDFAKLEGMLTTAKKEIAEQDAKLALLRDYGKAEQLLAAVEADAARVSTEAAKKKEEAKAAALQAQHAAQEAVKTTQELVKKGPVGKDRAALQAIKADAQGLTTSLSEVQKALDAGDYQAAQTKAKAIHEKSQAVQAEIQRAMTKVGAPKARRACR
ncbi:MAG: hypothetical protein ACREI2_06290 [Nitrospiraceae bacterium]